MLPALNETSGVYSLKVTLKGQGSFLFPCCYKGALPAAVPWDGKQIQALHLDLSHCSESHWGGGLEVEIPEVK